MPGLLVTGFEPFGKDTHNPSGAAVRRLSDRKAADPLGPWRDVTFQVLPVSWRDGPALLRQHIEATRPAAVLMFGLASLSPTVHLERCAHNLAGAGLVDNDGVVGQGTELTPGAAASEATVVDLVALEQRLLGAGVPVKRSEDAGRFLCNAVYHLALTTHGPHGANAVFVHVPATRSCGGALDDATVEGWIETTVTVYRQLTGAGTDT